jgi:hypothetical protein
MFGIASRYAKAKRKSPDFHIIVGISIITFIEPFSLMVFFPVALLFEQYQADKACLQKLMHSNTNNLSIRIYPN